MDRTMLDDQWQIAHADTDEAFDATPEYELAPTHFGGFDALQIKLLFLVQLVEDVGFGFADMLGDGFVDAPCDTPFELIDFSTQCTAR